jgi:copper chaperone CopZ
MEEPSMNFRNLLAAFAVVAMFSLTARAADTNVTLSDVHLCCGSCVTNANNVLAGVAGAKGTCDRTAHTIAITAPDQATAQKAVNALVAAGFFGKSSDSAIKVEALSGAKDGKVQTLEVAGVHLCCNSCVTAVKGVLGKVDGVTGNSVVQKAPTFNVTGDFSAKQLFEELNKAGLAGHVGGAPAMAN